MTRDDNPYHDLFDDVDELMDEELEMEVGLGMAVPLDSHLPPIKWPASKKPLDGTVWT
jgi:hypothetical protein